MPIEISVQNTLPYPIGFPRSYLQARGPAMTLVESETGKRKVLKIGLADHALMTQWTPLKPGQMLTLSTVIYETELTAFRTHHVDLLAEISVSARIDVPDQEGPVSTKGNNRLRIIGQDTLDRDRSVPQYIGERR